MKDPPFDISQAMLTDVAEISELVGRISSEKPSTNLTLRRANRIRTIQGTLAIEQNTLSIDQVTDVLNGKHVIAPPRDITEVRNAYTTYERMGILDPYSVDSLLYAHGIMMHGLIDEAGTFRSGPVAITDGKGHILHVGTLPRYVPESVERLLEWVHDSKLPMVIKSSVFHYEFEMIHPFADGNGRIGRLWHTRLLAEWNPVFSWLPIESVIHNRQQEYYRAINASNVAGKSTVFIGFMLGAIKAALLESSGTGDEALGKNALNAAVRRQFVLEHLEGNSIICNSDLRQGLGVSPATANRILRDLCEDGTLERIRAGKTWAYRLSDR